MKKIFTIILAIIIIIIAISAWIYYNEQNVNTTLTVYAAGSLAVPFTQLQSELESLYPNITINIKFGGSVGLMREIMNNASVDVFASADWSIIPEMYPNYANFDIGFALNQMALVYNNYTLKYLNVSQINDSNWFKILSMPNVKFGFSDGNVDPAGYSALMVLALSNLYYHENIFQNIVGKYTNIKIVQRNSSYYILLPPTDELSFNTSKIMIEPKETDLLPALESNQIQFLWIYKSDAIQKKLPYLSLPDEINMGSTNISIINNYYNKIYVYVGYNSTSQKLIECRPIIYGITIPTHAKNIWAAEIFIKFLLERNGQEIMDNAGQTPIYPAYANNISNVPSMLREDVTLSGITP
ncbi:MAG: tungstate ABC transporter substrate-binding protein WtpA [Thermoplasmata archaeon]